MTFVMHKGVTGATATRAFSGYGSHRTLHMLEDGLIVISDAQIVRLIRSREMMETSNAAEHSR